MANLATIPYSDVKLAASVPTGKIIGGTLTITWTDASGRVHTQDIKS